jgi:hypothetical protein
MAQQPLVGKGLRNLETSRSYSDTQHLVGILWTSDQPAAETSISHKRQTYMPLAGFEPAIPVIQWSQTGALDCEPLGSTLRFSHQQTYPIILFILLQTFYNTTDT